MNKAIVLAILALTLVSSCKSGLPVLSHQNRKMESVKVGVMTVEEAEAEDGRSFIGTVEPARTVVITAPFPGTLVSLKARKGDLVKKGDILAEIHSQAVESSYKLAASSLEQAEDAYDRMALVYPEGSISEVQMVEVKTKLAQARAAMESAAKSLEDCKIKAPFEGVVNSVPVNEGVDIIIGTPIAAIVDMSDLEIKISIHENEISKIAPGTRAEVEIPAFGISGLGARVTDKSLTSSTLSHSYECTLRFDSLPERILPGMSVKVKLHNGGGRCIIVPAACVQVDKNSRYVWLYDDGIARKAEISIGDYSGKGIIITDGLSKGDRIIVTGYQKVSGGMKVTAE